MRNLWEVYQSQLSSGVISTIIGLGAFREKYGYYAGATKGYQLSAAWQTVITNASFIGNIM